MYPKAVAPLTQVVYDAANARAERWMLRYYKVVAERNALLAELKELKS